MEHAKQDIENMVNTWMQEQNTSQWRQDIRFVWLMKNRAYRPDIKTTPYEALFEYKIKIELNTSNLSIEVIKNIEIEEDLIAIIQNETATNIERENPISKTKTNNVNAFNFRKKSKINLDIHAD